MRIIPVQELIPSLKSSLAELGIKIDPAVTSCIKSALQSETAPLAWDVLTTLLENYQIAETQQIPLCQDTGTVVIFAEIGEEVCFTDGNLLDTLNQAVREAFTENYFRKSIVTDPVFHRINTQDNTPAIIHTEIVPDDKLILHIALKGGGAENMSALRMLKPSDGLEGIKAFVLDTIIKAGGNPCPPLIVGIGIGGNFETCALLAKKAIFRDMGSHHPDIKWAAFELEMLDAINQTGVGAQGLGGNTTALQVNILTAPCHIASLPVAVNLNCHAHRHTKLIF
jgi:fumarate hydratase subunit alpha